MTMQDDFLTWVMIALIPVTILSLVWLFIHTFRKFTVSNESSVGDTSPSTKLYRARFAILIIAPILALVATFYLSAVVMDGVYGGLMMLSGGAVYALNIAIITASAILFAISLSNIRQIKKDLLSKTYLADSILRSSKKLQYLTRIFAVILIIPLAYVSLQYAYTFLTTGMQDQQFCKTAQKTSYTDKDEMMKAFLAALNESDVEKASGFYYHGQAGSAVIPTIGYFIEDKKTEPNNKYAQYGFPDWSPCRTDSSGNQSCAVQIGSNGIHDMLKEAKTNHWFMLASENYDYPTVCKD